jgi:hypothetical protein
MLVFISWSGPQSKAVAQALESWLKVVIQAVEPWISVDIEKGRRWSAEISAKLEQSRFGIICLTKENLKAPWILFEAGAISKSADSNACTLLLDVKHSDIEYPLAQFQHTKAEKDDVFQLLKTINVVVSTAKERALDDATLSAVFETNWPRLEKALIEASKIKTESQVSQRTQADMLQEILELMRNQERRASLTENLRRLVASLPPRRRATVSPGEKWLDTVRTHNALDAVLPLLTKDDLPPVADQALLASWLNVLSEEKQRRETDNDDDDAAPTPTKPKT